MSRALTASGTFGARAASALTRLFGAGGSGRPGNVGPRALKLLNRVVRTDDPAELLRSFQDAVDLILTAPPRSFVPELQQPLWTALDLAMRSLVEQPELELTEARVEIGCIGVAHHVSLACLSDGQEPIQPANTIADLADHAAVFANDVDNTRRLLMVRLRAELGQGQDNQEPA